MPQLFAWLMSPLLPAVVLVAGAAVIWVGRRRWPPRWPSLPPVVYDTLPVVALLAAVVAIWSLRQPVSPSRFILILPTTLGADLTLRVQLDEWGRLFGLFLLWPALALAGSFFAAKEPADSPAWSQWLLLLAAAHVVLAAADWLTLGGAMILFDLVYLILFASPSDAERGFLTNGLGGLIFLAAAFRLSLDGHSLALAGSEPLPPRAALLVAVAVLVRLAPYPFHLWLSELQKMPLPAWRWPVRLLSPALGLYLVGRIVLLLEGPMPLATPALIVGVAGCLATALLAWLNAPGKPMLAMAFAGLYQVSLTLVSWVVVGEGLAGFWLALGLILATPVVAMHRAWSDGRGGKPLIWWSAVPGGLAAAALAGLPLTVGLFVRLPLYGALLAGRRAGWLALLLLADGALAAAIWRVWGGLDSGALARKVEGKRPSLGLWAAMALLTVPLLLLGLFPSLAAWLAGWPPDDGFTASTMWGQLAQAGIGLWATLLLPPLMGYGIYRYGVAWSGQMTGAEAQLTPALRLDWLHRIVGQSLDRLRQAVWIVGAMLHGEGYVAWVVFSLLLVFLLILSR